MKKPIKFIFYMYCTNIDLLCLLLLLLYLLLYLYLLLLLLLIFWSGGVKIYENKEKQAEKIEKHLGNEEQQRRLLRPWQPIEQNQTRSGSW